MTDLYLASQSPRRAELLQQIGVKFSPLSVNVPEQRLAGESPEFYVERLSREKAAAGQAKAGTQIPVLGADTIVLQGQTLLEKPESAAQARDMLAGLSGGSHQVISGVSLVCGERVQTCVVSTQVNFKVISSDEIAAYVATGEPMDKSGAYGIQGYGAVFVESVSGSYSNVVGLPLFETAKLLEAFSVPVWQA